MELVPVVRKLLIPEGFGVLEVQEVDAVLSPDDEVGAPEATTAGCA